MPRGWGQRLPGQRALAPRAERCGALLGRAAVGTQRVGRGALRQLAARVKYDIAKGPDSLSSVSR